MSFVEHIQVVATHTRTCDRCGASESLSLAGYGPNGQFLYGRATGHGEAAMDFSDMALAQLRRQLGDWRNFQVPIKDDYGHCKNILLCAACARSYEKWVHG